MEIKHILVIAGISLALLGVGTILSQRNLGDSALPNTFLSATNSSVAVSAATSTSILALNGVRQYASICNDSANTVYLSFGATAFASKGYRLATATCLEINNTKGFLGAINAIASSSTSTLTTIEK